jgi:hypothetical protein
MNGGLKTIVDGIHWPRLRDQKTELVRLANEQEDSKGNSASLLWGVILLIDKLQDWAVDVGGIAKEDVFTTEEASDVVINAGIEEVKHG